MKGREMRLLGAKTSGVIWKEKGMPATIERPLLILTLAFAAGIAAGVYISFPEGPLLIAAAFVLYAPQPHASLRSSSPSRAVIILFGPEAEDKAGGNTWAGLNRRRGVRRPAGEQPARSASEPEVAFAVGDPPR